ncbi:MAG: hypothetical protein A2Y06_03320 [Omnitrophica WOR_2 bacterium GWA2_37_7]|nr:MAG: hypothetical protein A2Y06_03320 [Omnitrophica WOR_2 bacterium GWA2_37_7]
MKIAFVNDSCEHLGIEYISSVLKLSGHKTKLFVDPLLFDDEFITVKLLAKLFDSKKNLVRDLKVYRPDLVCISVVSSFYPWASQIAEMIKKEMNTPILMGGIHPSSVPEFVIENKDVDMVCIGEGEYPILELANSLQNGTINYSIKNIWFKNNGQIIKNEIRPLIEDLDSLPFPDKDLYFSESPHFSKSYYIAASRGCPHSCTYCCNSYYRHLYKDKGKYVRLRSVDNVIEELQQAKAKYNIKPIFFLDDCFGYDIEWLKDFSVKYKEEIGTGFYCMMFPSNQMKESLKYLKNAGCGEIEIGVQSWDEETRKNIFKRNVSNEIMIETMKLIRKENINLVTGDILGYPGQKEEHIIKAAQIYSEIRPSRTYPFILKYFPKTDITASALNDGSLSEKDHNKILSGDYGKYLSADGNMTKKDVLQYLFLFLLVRILPQNMAQWVINKRVYSKIPVLFTPAIISILNNFSTSTYESKVNRKSALSRYVHFFVKKIFNK